MSTVVSHHEARIIHVNESRNGRSSPNDAPPPRSAAALGVCGGSGCLASRDGFLSVTIPLQTIEYVEGSGA